MEKSSILSVVEVIQRGEFKSVLQEIRYGEFQLDTNVATKIVVACCTVCNNHVNDVNFICEDDLQELLLCIIPYINSPKEQHLNNYAASVLHILKLLALKVSGIL